MSTLKSDSYTLWYTTICYTTHWNTHSRADDYSHAVRRERERSISLIVTFVIGGPVSLIVLAIAVDHRISVLHLSWFQMTQSGGISGTRCSTPLQCSTGQERPRCRRATRRPEQVSEWGNTNTVPVCGYERCAMSAWRALAVFVVNCKYCLRVESLAYWRRISSRPGRRMACRRACAALRRHDEAPGSRFHGKTEVTRHGEDLHFVPAHR